MTAMANRTAISIKVVGLGGSMAAPSRSLAALKLDLGAQEAGATTELLDLRELSLPMYVPTTHDFPTAVYRLLDEVYGAHGVRAREGPIVRRRFLTTFDDQRAGEARECVLLSTAVGFS